MEAHEEGSLPTDLAESTATLTQKESSRAENGDPLSFVEEAGSPGSSSSLRQRFHLPSRERLLTWLPFWGVILLGVILRFWGLGDKPLHHDESLHAFYSLQLLHNTISQWGGCVIGSVSNCYAYSPWLHGPFQFHAI